MAARERIISNFKNKSYDILIVGGGATGLGVALDATLRGLSVALIETNDYSSGPSSTSTKLLHGGVRYLEKAVRELDWGQYKLVREALEERDIALKNNPSLGNPVSLIIPVYSTWDKIYYKIGTWLYDFVAGSKVCPSAQWISTKEAWNLFPVKAQNLKGALLYWDGQFNDALYASALLISAIQKGADALNYTRLMAWNGKIAEVNDVVSGETFQIQAKCLVNCTGVQSDNIRLMVKPQEKPRLRPSKGIHIVIDKKFLPSQTGMLVPKTEDGRVIFILPWLDVCLIGTTDTEQKDSFSEPFVTPSDVNYLLKQIQPYLSHEVKKSDILSVFAGNRPLVTQQKSKTEAIIRNHELEVWQMEKVISVLGGKWTTYRQMAEEAVDEVEKMLNKPHIKSQTKDFPLQLPEIDINSFNPNIDVLDMLQIWTAKDFFRRGTRLELRNMNLCLENLLNVEKQFANHFFNYSVFQEKTNQNYRAWLGQYQWLWHNN